MYDCLLSFIIDTAPDSGQTTTSVDHPSVFGDVTNIKGPVEGNV